MKYSGKFSNNKVDDSVKENNKILYDLLVNLSSNMMYNLTPNMVFDSLPSEVVNHILDKRNITLTDGDTYSLIKYYLPMFGGKSLRFIGSTQYKPLPPIEHFHSNIINMLINIENNLTENGYEILVEINKNKHTFVINFEDIIRKNFINLSDNIVISNDVNNQIIESFKLYINNIINTIINVCLVYLKESKKFLENGFY